MAKEKKGTNLEQKKDDGAQLAQMMQELSDTQRHEVKGIVIGMCMTNAAMAARAEA